MTFPVRDPATQLIVSCKIPIGIGICWLRDHEYREGQPSNQEWVSMPAGKILYENFLRRRKSIMMELHRFEIILEGRARESAIQAGMFGLWGDEPAIVDARDLTTLRKYKDLLEQGNGAWAIDRTTDADILYGVEAMEALDMVHGENVDYDDCGYSGHATPASFMRLLLHVLGKVAEIKFDWNCVVGCNGKVKKDHPMVKKLGLPLPDWTPVVVFELLSEEDTRREKKRMAWMYDSVGSKFEETGEGDTNDLKGGSK